MKRVLTFSVFLIVVGFTVAQAQCVTKYPYTYTFQNFDTLQIEGSCDLTVKGDNGDGWVQDALDDGDWRADTAGTVSLRTGPGSSMAGSGVGIGTDYTGSTSGTYLYAEATGCPSAEVAMISPCFDLGNTTIYRLKFGYHMFGATMGELHVDVYDGSSWTNSVWVKKGNQGEAWHTAYVLLEDYANKKIQLRLRAITGTAYLSDIAIDHIVVEEAPEFDLAITNVWRSAMEYSMIPEKQASGNLDVDINVFYENAGTDSISGIKVLGVNNKWRDSVTTTELGPGDTIRTQFSTTFTSDSKDTLFEIEGQMTQTDGYTNNNQFDQAFDVISDTVLAKDYGVITNAIGVTGTSGIRIGQQFEVLQDDTVTSFTFLLNGPEVGDSVRAHLYEFSGGPQNLIQSSYPIVITSANPLWYTATLPCEEALSKGDYFVAIEQMGDSNMSLGIDGEIVYPQTVYYSFGGAWTDLGTQFPGITLIRMNFGEVKGPEIYVSLTDTICDNVEYIVNASGAATYSWAPFGIVRSKTGNTVKVKSDTSFTLRVTGTDQCKVSAELVKDITVVNAPSLTLTPDTTVCAAQSVLLQANTGANYRWVGGPNNSNYNVNPTKTTVYTAIADSLYGCKTQKFVSVYISKPTPEVTNDTTICASQPLKLKALGGTSYQWIGGPSASEHTVNPSSNTSYIVQVIDDYNCSAYDTVNVTTKAGPPLYTSADTSICFGNKVLVKAYGAQSYEWIGGPKTAEYLTQPLSSKPIIVKGFAPNGCYVLDSVMVEVATIPKVDVRADTIICEGTTLDLEAKTQDDVTFDWSTNETTKTIQVSPKVNTAYKVVVKNSTGCSAEDSVRLIVNPLPVLDLTITQAHKTLSILNSSKNVDKHKWTFGDNDSSTEKSVTHKYLKHGDYQVYYSATNGCGKADTTFTVVVENLSVSQKSAFGNLSVYPNPAEKNVVVEFTNSDRGVVQVNVLDATGKVVYQHESLKINNTFIRNVDIDGLSAGSYLIEITSTSGTSVTKLLKQ